MGLEVRASRSSLRSSTTTSHDIKQIIRLVRGPSVKQVFRLGRLLIGYGTRVHIQQIYLINLLFLLGLGLLVIAAIIVLLLCRNAREECRLHLLFLLVDDWFLWFLLAIERA